MFHFWRISRSTYTVIVLKVLMTLLLMHVHLCLVTSETLAVKNIIPSDTTEIKHLVTSKISENRHHLTSNKSEVKIAVIISHNKSRLFSINRIQPALDYAIEGIRNRSLLPTSVKIKISYSDSHCNPKDAPISAFNFYMEHNVDVFFGPVCDYSLAPVARYAPYWNLPVISPGGFAYNFGENKSHSEAEFPTLTRVGATFDTLSQCILNTLWFHDWHKLLLIYDGNGKAEVMPSFCFLAGSSLIHYVKSVDKNWIKEYAFELVEPGKDDVEKILRYKVALNFSSKYYFSSKIHMYIPLKLAPFCTLWKSHPPN